MNIFNNAQGQPAVCLAVLNEPLDGEILDSLVRELFPDGLSVKGRKTDAFNELDVMGKLRFLLAHDQSDSVLSPR